MILDMVNKKHPEYVWRYLAMCFIEKFMGIHRVKIKSFQPEIFDEFKHWVMVQGIKYSTTSFLELRKNDYIFRYWTRKDFHLAFLDREIEFNK